MTHRHIHQVHAWGTVIVLDLRGEHLNQARADAACRAAAAELLRIDAWLSPYRTDSAVSAIRRGDAALSEVPEPVREVIDGCARVTDWTGGAFDPWRAPGGFDPSGFVKGWGADRTADLLAEHGFANVSVNAAGDVSCRGEASEGLGGWRIGIADPRDRTQVLSSVLVTDAHLATSGRYEQGDHIVDPATGMTATAMRSASVLSRHGGEADALATALMVQGPAGLPALTRAAAEGLLVSHDRIWSTSTAFERAPITA